MVCGILAGRLLRQAGDRYGRRRSRAKAAVKFDIAKELVVSITRVASIVE